MTVAGSSSSGQGSRPYFAEGLLNQAANADMVLHSIGPSVVAERSILDRASEPVGVRRTVVSAASWRENSTWGTVAGFQTHIDSGDRELAGESSPWRSCCSHLDGHLTTETCPTDRRKRGEASWSSAENEISHAAVVFAVPHCELALRLPHHPWLQGSARCFGDPKAR